MNDADAWQCLSGQYLLADSAYGLTDTVIPTYKAPAAYEASKAEFNFRLAESRVRNEHTIGILKARFVPQGNALAFVSTGTYDVIHQMDLRMYDSS